MPCPSGRRPDQNRHRLADGWHRQPVRRSTLSSGLEVFAVAGGVLLSAGRRDERLRLGVGRADEVAAYGLVQ